MNNKKRKQKQTNNHTKALFIGGAVLVLGLIAFAYLVKVRTLAVDEECGQPPDPFYGNKVNIDLTLGSAKK